MTRRGRRRNHIYRSNKTKDNHDADQRCHTHGELAPSLLPWCAHNKDDSDKKSPDPRYAKRAHMKVSENHRENNPEVFHDRHHSVLVSSKLVVRQSPQPIKHSSPHILEVPVCGLRVLYKTRLKQLEDQVLSFKLSDLGSCINLYGRIQNKDACIITFNIATCKVLNNSPSVIQPIIGSPG